MYVGTIYRSYSFPVLLPNKILVFPFFINLNITLDLIFFSLYFFKYPDLFKVKMFRVYGLVKRGDIFILFMAFCLCGILLSNFGECNYSLYFPMVPIPIFFRNQVI